MNSKEEETTEDENAYYCNLGKELRNYLLLLEKLWLKVVNNTK